MAFTSEDAQLARNLPVVRSTERQCRGLPPVAHRRCLGPERRAAQFITMIANTPPMTASHSMSPMSVPRVAKMIEFALGIVLHLAQLQPDV
jgi:hypothetical protein